VVPWSPRFVIRWDERSSLAASRATGAANRLGERGHFGDRAVFEEPQGLREGECIVTIEVHAVEDLLPAEL
jgi:hypothetical protein